MCDYTDSQKSSSYNNRRMVSMNKYEHETVKGLYLTIFNK